MIKKPFSKQFQSLPPYMGGKRRLVSWIFQALSKAVPPSNWYEMSFIDAFVGGGAVSLYAKSKGFKQLLCNDWSDRSQIVLQALLENQLHQLSREEVLLLTRPLPCDSASRFIQEHFNPSVFALRHAEALDRLSYWSAQIQNPTKRALAKLLIWHLISDFVCFGTSIGSSSRPYAEALDGLRDWQELNPRRFADGSLSNLLKPTWQSLEKWRKHINKGVFTGSPVMGFQLDATDFVRQVQGDILYLDPPYPGCLSYESTNRVLDSILTGKLQPTHSSSSPFTKDTQALETLLEQARHIPIWILSYGNKQVSLEDLVTLVRRHCPNRNIEAHARAFKHLSHVSKRISSQELLVIARN